MWLTVLHGVTTTPTPSTRAIEEKKDSDSWSPDTNIKIAEFSRFISLKIISHEVAVKYFQSLISKIYCKILVNTSQFYFDDSRFVVPRNHNGDC